MIDGGESHHLLTHFRYPDFLIHDGSAIVFQVEGGGRLPVESRAAGCKEDFGATSVISGPGETDCDCGFPTLRHDACPPAQQPHPDINTVGDAFIQEGRSIAARPSLYKG